jgi:nucleoside-diphosphate kinase
MKKVPALVIIKPEGLYRALVGEVLNKFSETDLDMVAMRLVEVTRPQAEEHYKNIQNQPFFKGVINHLMGKYHEGAKVVVIVYYGKDAIRKCRKMAGATNPEEADPQSIRGAFGRVTKDGIYENVVHVSSDAEEAKREIRLWLSPEDIYAKLYPSKTVKENGVTKKVWK